MMDPSKEKRENTELEQQSTNINEGRVQREKEAENHEDPGFKNVLFYSSAYIQCDQSSQAKVGGADPRKKFIEKKSKTP